MKKQKIDQLKMLSDEQRNAIKEVLAQVYDAKLTSDVFIKKLDQYIFLKIAKKQVLKELSEEDKIL